MHHQLALGDCFFPWKSKEIRNWNSFLSISVGLNKMLPANYKLNLWLTSTISTLKITYQIKLRQKYDILYVISNSTSYHVAMKTEHTSLNFSLSRSLSAIRFLLSSSSLSAFCVSVLSLSSLIIFLIFFLPFPGDFESSFSSSSELLYYKLKY